MAKTYTGVVLEARNYHAVTGPPYQQSFRSAVMVVFTENGRRYQFVSPEETEMSQGHWFKPGTVTPAISPGDTITVRATAHFTSTTGTITLNRVRRIMPTVVAPPPPVVVDPVLDAVATYEAVMEKVYSGKLETRREFTEAYEELEKADLVLIQTMRIAQQHRVILDDHKALLLKRVEDAK